MRSSLSLLLWGRECLWGRWWGGNKTASWPSANYTSAQRTACFLFTLVTANCCVLLSIHLSIHPLALNENTLVFLILWDYISSTHAQTQQMSSSLFCGHMSTCVCAQTWEIHVFERLMQKLQLCISLPVLSRFISLCPSPSLMIWFTVYWPFFVLSFRKCSFLDGSCLSPGP